MSTEEERNYYPDLPFDPTGLKYRLEGDDVIKGVVDILRGGLLKDEKGRHRYNERYRLLNEEGVARVELFLRGGVNKINHLTKYKNEGRILQQMKSLIRGFTIELVLNMKWWAPGSYNVSFKNKTVLLQVDEGVIEKPIIEVINDPVPKVRNKHLVLLVVENALFQSMQRGQEGFEAELTGKSWNVMENVGQNPYAEQQQRRNLLGGLFGRREQ